MNAALSWRMPIVYLATLVAATGLLAGCPTVPDIPRGQAPVADFRANQQSGEAPLSVQFTDLSLGATAWQWSFGDGTLSDTRNPSHIYQQAGTYTVSLSVFNAEGSDTLTRNGYITVTTSGGGGGGLPPTAGFSGSPRSGSAPLNVQFQDFSHGNGSAITTWLWNFGDGTTSTLRNPLKTYTQAGYFGVSLTVTNANGSTTRSEPAYISVTGGTPDTPPTAAFSASPRNGGAPLQVQFTDQSTAGSASITAWRWEFGDGVVSTERNPGHTFTAPGSYTVRLRVTTAIGSDDEVKNGYIVVNSQANVPTAQFSASPRTGTAPLVVQFTDSSSGNGAAITDWLWTFGDGATSTQRNPQKTYAAPGNYTVSLRVTNAAGTHTETKAQYITVSGGGGGGSQAEYDRGFEDGFAVDAEYWQGYDDSWDTRDGGPIYYSGSEIPYYDELSYEAGYWDGVWYAYNDGYFVAYDYAFTIGFSEGYDLAFYPDWYDFLRNDEHVEWLDGGFSDGYNDGFSEGRILGAVDYREGLAYDWLDALLWYREGNDAYIEELDLGTGEYGPVYLYEWGTDPHDLVKKSDQRTSRVKKGNAPAIRKNAAAAKAEEPGISYRPLDDYTRNLLNVAPEKSPRSVETLQLDTTWLQRIQAYLQSLGKSAKRARTAAG